MAERLARIEKVRGGHRVKRTVGDTFLCYPCREKWPCRPVVVAALKEALRKQEQDWQKTVGGCADAIEDELARRERREAEEQRDRLAAELAECRRQLAEAQAERDAAYCAVCRLSSLGKPDFCYGGMTRCALSTVVEGDNRTQKERIHDLIHKAPPCTKLAEAQQKIQSLESGMKVLRPAHDFLERELVTLRRKRDEAQGAQAAMVQALEANTGYRQGTAGDR